MLRWGFGIALLLSSQAAWAEEAAAPPAEQPVQAVTPPAAPDVVVLKNGDRFRGTIAELARDRAITIVLVTGETRKLDPSDVKYAGPAEREPFERPAPAPVPHARGLDDAPPGQQRVRLLSNEPRTEFFYRPSGQAVAFTSLCIAPCASPLPNGAYQFGLKAANEDNITPLRTVLIDVPTTLTGEIERRNGAHTAGAIVILLSVLGASLTTVYAKTSDHPSEALGIMGYGAALAGAAVGITLALAPRGASLRVSQTP